MKQKIDIPENPINTMRGHQGPVYVVRYNSNIIFY